MEIIPTIISKRVDKSTGTVTQKESRRQSEQVNYSTMQLTRKDSSQKSASIPQKVKGKLLHKTFLISEANLQMSLGHSHF